MSVDDELILSITPPDLSRASVAGARIMVWRYRDEGLLDATIRRLVTRRFRAIFSPGHLGEYERETLMAQVQRTLEATLAEPGPPRDWQTFAGTAVA